MVGIKLTTPAYTTPRKPRFPQHRFYVAHQPWDIQQCVFAPVVAGETLRSAQVQIRAVTKPIKNPLIGWHYEFYLFYVKHRDLLGSDDASIKAMGAALVSMTLDTSKSVTSIDGGGNTLIHAADVVRGYAAAGTSALPLYAYRRIVEEYFRDEGETWDFRLSSSNQPVAQHGYTNVLQSAINETLMPDGATVDTGDGTGTTTVAQLEEAYRAWEAMTAEALTNMSYEDFLKMHGIRGKLAQEPHKPELIRYVRQWQYPSNTIDPTNGTPRSAVSWSLRERADKRRFFSEPGILVGIVCARPKIYASTQNGNAVGLLEKGRHWLPAFLHEDDFSTLEDYAADAGIITDSGTEGYWLDLRDLYIYGDQFIGGPSASVALLTPNLVGSLTVSSNKIVEGSQKYPGVSATTLDADQDAIFVDQDVADQYVEADGVVSFHISGHQEDRT